MAKQSIFFGKFMGECSQNSCDDKLHPSNVEDSFFSDDHVYQGDTPTDLSQHVDYYLYEKE